MCKVAQDKSEIIKEIPMACADEATAVEFIEKLRWDGEPSCPRCGDLDVYNMTDRKTGERNSRYLWRCHGCKKQFTVRIGTVMEDSRIPLYVWCYAFWAACSSKKGVSALQIKRQTGLSYKSALFLMHRIRFAMASDSAEPLTGDVEVDETYVGGKPRKPSKASPEYRALTGRNIKPGRTPDFMDRKTPVIALVQRNGGARAYVPTDVQGKNLKNAVRENVDRSARIHTDQLSGYRGIGKEFEGGHHTVNHSIKEYARQEGDLTVTTNTVEAFFALLKRGVIGTFHNVSKKHLHRYVAEFEFRWNTRDMDDGARVAQAIRQAEGKRLRYAQP